MSDSKALETWLLHHKDNCTFHKSVNGGNAIPCSCGRDRAAAELAQLRAELEMNKANLESFMQLQGEHKKLCDLVAERYKIYLKDQAEMVRLSAELDEKNSALELIGDLAYDRDGWKSAEKLGELVDEIYGYARDTKKAAEINNSKTRPEETK